MMDRRLIVVNLSDSGVQACVQVPWSEVPDLLSLGLYVELEPWGCHFFQCSRTGKGRSASAAATGS
jgi:hypothetical protein